MSVVCYFHKINLEKDINIIFRNYELKDKKPLVKKIIAFCKKNSRKLFISNDYKLALNLDLDGLYIPSFNKNLKFVFIDVSIFSYKIHITH